MALQQQLPTMNRKLMEQTLAMAGVVQAANLVETVAKTGEIDFEAFETSIYSIFQQNPESTESVFKDRSYLRLGLRQLDNMLNNNVPQDRTDTVRYTMSILHLQKRLERNNKMLEVIGKRIQQANLTVEHFSLTHENVIANIASIYQDTLSTFRFRVQVTGNLHYLKQPATADRIRALLLAGVRSATLWRQLGGNRWQFVFKRRQMSACAKELLY